MSVSPRTGNAQIVTKVSPQKITYSQRSNHQGSSIMQPAGRTGQKKPNRRIRKPNSKFDDSDAIKNIRLQKVIF